MKKVPRDLDYIVVGSGMSALYCASMLSLCGYRVLVLEQHYIAGGIMHEWEDKGFKFDTGVHYVGRREQLDFMLNLVQPGWPKAEPIQWEQIGEKDTGYVYDTIKMGANGKSYDTPVSADASREALFRDFPDEREAIAKFFEYVEETFSYQMPWMWSKLFPSWLRKTMLWLLQHKYPWVT